MVSHLNAGPLVTSPVVDSSQHGANCTVLSRSELVEWPCPGAWRAACCLVAEPGECSASCLQRCCASIPGQITHRQDVRSETAPSRSVSFLYSLWKSLYCSDQSFVLLFVTKEVRHEPTQSYCVPSALESVLFPVSVSPFHVSKRFSVRVAIF